MQMTPRQAVVLLLLVGGVMAAAIGALLLRDRFRKRGEPSPRVKAADLPDSERRRLREAFWRRRNLAIGGFVLPFLLWAAGAFFAKSLEGVLVFGARLAPAGAAATFAVWGLDLLFTLVFVRCPLCGSVPLSLMNQGDSGYNGTQKSSGLDMSPDYCRDCGLDFRGPS